MQRDRVAETIGHRAHTTQRIHRFVTRRTRRRSHCARVLCRAVALCVVDVQCRRPSHRLQDPPPLPIVRVRPAAVVRARESGYP